MGLRLTAAADDAKGGLLKKVDVRSLRELRLVAVFENIGPEPLAVVGHFIPPDYGRYELEMSDGSGRAFRPHPIGGCGTRAPLQDHEITSIAPGAVFRTPFHPGFYSDTPSPGPYKARLPYSAWRPPGRSRPMSPVVAARVDQLWTGDLVSDCVDVTILPS